MVARFFAWCDGLVAQVLDETPLAAAIGYARNQRDALERFLDGRPAAAPQQRRASASSAAK